MDDQNPQDDHDHSNHIFVSGNVRYDGPMVPHHEVTVTGRRVPYLKAYPQKGDLIYLSVDDRYGVEVTVEEAERVVPFVAHCIAVGLGYVGHPDADHDPVPRVHFSIVHNVAFVEREGDFDEESSGG